MNQDKTSKQISSLRLEIQKLTMELMEFKQVGISTMPVSKTVLIIENDRKYIKRHSYYKTNYILLS